MDVSLLTKAGKYVRFLKLIFLILWGGATLAQAQETQSVKGIVIDAKEQVALPGVNVFIKGTGRGVITDQNGAFSIEASSSDALVFSYIGYLAQELKVTSKTMKVALVEDSQVLDDVVVVGYGSAKRVNLSGAIATVDSKVFESRPVQNAAMALQGEVAGVTITRPGGAPGSTATIRIRDISSINGGSPLVLIDGAEGSLDQMNSADIENISVLKDGSAAIYGARAADGVILVTTKSGRRNQKTKVQFDGFYSIKRPALMKKQTDLYQYALMGLEISDGSWTPDYTEEELPLLAEGSDKIVPNGIWGAYPKFYQYVDKKDIIGNGSLQNYNVTITGGGAKYGFLLSGGYQHEEGLPKYGRDNHGRYSIRAKSNVELWKGVNLDLNLSYQATDRRSSSAIEGRGGVISPLWEMMFRGHSWAPLRNPAGNWYTFQYYASLPQALEEMGDKETVRGDLTVNGKLDWQIYKDLKLVGQAIVRKADGDEQAFYRKLYGYDWDNNDSWSYGDPNYAYRQYDKTLYKNFTLFAEYKKKFVDKHDLSLMAGVSHESSNFDKFYAARQNFNQQEVFSLSLGSPENQVATSEGNAWTINSYYGRFNYGFSDRYLLEANFRFDGSSRFHPDYRWGFFPSVSAAWRLGEESFIKSLSIFDNLKIRASYGEMGNQSGIGLYDYIQLLTISSAAYPFGKGNKGQLAYSNGMVSPTRSWETIQTTNIGLDFSVLNSRLSGTFDYYWKNNTNMLIPLTYPTVLGAAAPSTNNGRLEVKGWEASLGWRDQVGELNYSVRLSVSDSKNCLVEKGGNDTFTLGLNQTRKGYPTNSYFGYIFDGIIQNEQELEAYKKRFDQGGVPGNLRVGDAKYKDLDGDGTLSLYGNGKPGQGDAQYMGDQNPRYNFGFNLNLEYKGFDFGLFLQGVGKRTVFLEGDASRPFTNWWTEPLEYWSGKTWTPTRTDARYPAITLDGGRGYYNYYTSQNTQFNAAYLRLKNIQLGYTLPTVLSNKVKLEKVRFYFSGEDVFEIHNVPGGYDPEDGGYYSSYPFSRLFSFGVNLVF